MGYCELGTASPRLRQWRIGMVRNRAPDLSQAARLANRRGSVCALWDSQATADGGLPIGPLSDDAGWPRPKACSAQAGMGGPNGSLAGTGRAAVRQPRWPNNLPEDQLCSNRNGRADGFPIWQGQLWPLLRRRKACAP